MTAPAQTVHGGVTWEVATRGGLLLDDPRATAWAHAAMRHLAWAQRERRRPAPIVPVWVVDGTGRVEAHLAAPLGDAPGPWRTAGHVWEVDASALPGSPVGVGPEPWPVIVEIGHVGGRHVLVDLAAAPGLVDLGGSSRAVRGFVRQLAAHLVGAPWSQGVRVWIVGAGDARDSRVTCVDSVADVLSAPRPVPGGVTGRWGSAPRGDHDVVLSARPLGDAERRLIRAVSRDRGAPTVVGSGGGTGVWRWRLGAGSLAW